MALASPAICLPRSCGFSGNWELLEGRRRACVFVTSAASLICAGSGRADNYQRRVSESGVARAVAARGRLELSDAPAVENGHAGASVEIPVTCYQIIGVSAKAEKDEVVKVVMELKSSELEDGYTADVVHSRQDLLTDVRDKLLFEPEYAGNVKERVPPKASLRIPWGWLPAALCLLQEVGEDKLVLEIGRAALEHQGSKIYVHDLLLSMALAECSTAKTAFEKNQVAQGFEALARSQYFLRSTSSLEKMPLLSEIEESLEELAPACTLELLSLPRVAENGERRQGAISALQELLRQGLEVETSCRVQDWPCFLFQALNRLMAAEIVDLFSWVDLADTRKNKKSLESQNQRIVIDFNCFYTVMIAHVALGFSTRQRDLISKALRICECLVASEGIDLKYEEAFCSLLLGQVLEKTAVEKLHQLQVNGSSSKEAVGKTSASQSVDSWLKDSVLSVFPDTRDCPPSLTNFFVPQKRILGVINSQKGKPKANPETRHTSSHYLSLEKRSLEDTSMPPNSLRQMGEAVKQLAPPNIGKPSMDDNPTRSANISSMKGKSGFGLRQTKVMEGWWGPEKLPGAVAYVTTLGCIVFSSLKLFNMKFGERRPPALLKGTCTIGEVRSSSGIVSKLDNNVCGSLYSKIGKFFKIPENQCPAGNHIHLNSPAASAAVGGMIRRREMHPQEAEALIRKWQAVKAEALGSGHRVEILSDILSEGMLSEWKGLANSAKERSCFWRFLLLKLSILHANILSDGIGDEVAEIKVAIDEAAELVDTTQPKNPNYYSSYKIIYILKKDHSGSWRFCDSSIQEDSPL